MIELKNVSKIYYQNGSVATGFSKVSTKFDIGEFVVIVGDSGSGKSTLLNVISGLDTYEEGEMYINGEETSHFSDKEFEEYRRKYVANIFQAFNLVNSYTVRQNVELVLLLNGFTRKETKNKVNDILKKVDLWKLRNRRVSRLSGGQKQRVAIARALAKETPIIVADEPTGNLDKASADAIFKLLSEIAKDKLVVVVTHNIEQVEEYATRIVKMHDGKIIEDKKIKKIEKVEAVTSEYSEMRFSNKLFLSIRNALNVIPKFLLIFSIFFVLSFVLLFLVDGMFKTAYDDASNGSYLFYDNKPERIILKKKDKTSFNDEDYNFLSNIDHVKSINKFDSSDIRLELYTDEGYDYFPSKLKKLSDVNFKLLEGRVPEAENEILFIIDSSDSWMEEVALKEYYNKTVGISRDFQFRDYSNKYTVVGIAKNKDQESSIVVKDEYFPEYYRTSIYFNILYNKNLKMDIFDDMQVIPSLKVKEGEAYVINDLNISCKDMYCVNQKLKISAETLYYKNEIEVKIKKTLSNKGMDKMFELGKNFYYNDYVFISFEDYYKLISNAPYQASIYMDDYKNVDDALIELENHGYNALALKNTTSMLTSFDKLARFFKTIALVIVVVLLTMVSSFSINIILKSRNKYYAVVRMLGGNLKLNRTLINLELLFISLLSYLILCAGIILNNNYHFIKTSVFKFINPIHMVLVFVIVIGVTLYVSRQFAKKLFKDSMMVTYNMEV